MNTQTSSSEARQLVERLSSRLENEKRELVLFLIELAEFDTKKLALELGYPSTLGCLVRELGQLVMGIRFGAATSPPSVNIALTALATPPAATVAADAVATSATHEPLQPVTLWVGSAFLEELEAVRTLLGHAVPSGKREEVLLHVLRAQRKVLERRRYGSPKRATTPKPATTPKVPDSSRISATVRREVYNREGRSCAFVGEENRRCGSTLRLEYQHILPRARRGPSTPENVTLYCGAHNLLQAEKDFGEAHIKRKQLERSAANALVRLGYKRAQAEQAVRVAIVEGPNGSDLNALLRKSLRILGR